MQLLEVHVHHGAGVDVSITKLMLLPTKIEVVYEDQTMLWDRLFVAMDGERASD